MSLARAFAILLLLASTAVLAATYPPVSDRNFAIDLYSGAVLGSSRIVGMGGTGIAIAEGSAYTLVNVAAAAVRPSTSNGDWDWDAHLDWLHPDLGSDFDNNGDPVASVGHSSLLTAGVLGQYRAWGLAFTTSSLDDTIDIPGASQSSQVSAGQIKVALARSLLDRQLTVGLSFTYASFTLTDAPNSRDLFSASESGLELGALWRPEEVSYRAGLTASTPLTRGQPQLDGCDPMSCEGLILPDAVAVPWQLGLGFAYRFGPTAWNRQVDTPWRDERAVTLAADLLLSGSVSRGDGLEEFLQHRLQRSGASTSLSLRVGAEYEWVPGWIRLRGGSYWEPGRFENVGGRLHATFGVEARLFGFRLFGASYRLRVGLTADAARAYGNGALSLGFW